MRPKKKKLVNKNMKVENKNKEIKEISFRMGSQWVIKTIEEIKMPKQERRKRLLIIFK